MRGYGVPLTVAAAFAMAPVWGQAGGVLGPTIVGRIVWPRHNLSRAEVFVYADKTCRQLVGRFATGGEGGTFVALVDPGEYYLMAVVDANGNGKPDTGDGIGFNGVTASGGKDQEPKAIKVAAGATITDVAIPIVATLGEDGKPKALVEEAPAEPAPPSTVPATIDGKVTGVEGVAAPIIVLVLKANDHSPAAVEQVTAAEPSFQFSAAPGDYQVLALSVLSGSGKLGAGDAVGAYGVSDWSAAPEALPKLTLTPGATLGGLEVALSGRLGPDGLVSPAKGEGVFRLDLAALPAIIAGTVPYPGAGVKPVQVRLSADPGMAQLLATCQCRPGPASFAIAVPPRTYYLTAIVDENGDGRMGPGDAIGFYGVDDLASGKAPTPVTVSAGSILTGLKITMTIRLSEDGKPTPIPPAGQGGK